MNISKILKEEYNLSDDVIELGKKAEENYWFKEEKLL